MLELHRTVTAVVALSVANILIHPRVYPAVGLDPKHARAIAAANPHHHETLRWMAEKVVAFFIEVGMIGGPSKSLWRRAHLI